MAALIAIKFGMASTQDKNWAIVQEDWAISEKNLNNLRDCHQVSFANQQPIFDFDTVISKLSMIHAGIKSYCSALFAFRLTIYSIPVLLK